jgi:hypothetical protein
MFQKDSIELQLEKTILDLLEEVNSTQDKTSDEYAKMVDQAAKLYELRQKSRISPEALVTVASNLAGILLVMNHERAHVIASKAFSFVKKIF